MQFFTYISFFFVERSRVTPRGLVGHFWQAGHRLETPGLIYPRWPVDLIGFSPSWLESSAKNNNALSHLSSKLESSPDPLRKLFDVDNYEIAA